ncbi:MAG: multicopper oxidase domain-containing protein [Sphingobacterium hotanense]
MKKLRIYSILSILLLFSLCAMAQKVVRYDLYVKDTLVNYSGKEKRAIAVNGMIPMPTLTFTEGDTAEIHVHNEMDEPTSMHWHGVYLPNPEDGVPFLTQMPIKAKSTYIYRFPIIQNGTHWYHSHTGMQEQIGMYGAMILKKRGDDQDNRKGIDDLPSIPIILSEWTDLNPDNVHRMLHNANDWFAIKKNATQSYAEAIKEGHFKTKVTNEWKRMLAMDVSDVYYDRFLINGSSEQSLSDFKAGDKVRLRVINAGASSYFWLTYAGGKITVVANDGNDVEPVKVDRLLIAVSETYDIVVEIPEDGFAYEFMATPEDRTKNASIYVGSGVKQLVAPLPKLKYFEGMKMMNEMMKMNGDLDDMGMKMAMQRMDMNTVMYPEMEGKGMQHGDHQNMDHSATNKKEDKTHQEQQGMNHAEQKQDHSGHQNMAQHNQPDTTAAPHAQHQNSDIITLNYGMLRSPKSTKFPEGMPIRELKFELTGNMSRYVWSLDDKVLSEVDKIPIKKGEALRIILYNNSMMRHPMHLHGHDFRVLNGQGDYAPLKNVLDIMPMETDTIEFESNVHGDWFFHCHILYHMMAGMNRVFSTEGQPDNPKLPNKEKAYRMLQRESNMPHFMIQNDFATNGNDGELMLHNARWQLTSEWRLGYHDMHGYEVETHLGRFVDRMQWFMPFIGFDWRYRNLEGHGPETNIFGQTNSKHERALFSAGFVYTLPMLIRFQAELYHDGNVRLQLMREDIPLSKRLRGGFMVNSDKEYMADLRYIITRHMGIRTHYDSDMGFGVGLSLNY